MKSGWSGGNSRKSVLASKASRFQDSNILSLATSATCRLRLQVTRRERDGVAALQSISLSSDEASKRLLIPSLLVQYHINLDHARVHAEGRVCANHLETFNGGGEAADGNMGEEQFVSNAPELTADLVAVSNVFRVWSRLRRGATRSGGHKGRGAIQDEAKDDQNNFIRHRGKPGGPGVSLGGQVVIGATIGEGGCLVGQFAIRHGGGMPCCVCASREGGQMAVSDVLGGGQLERRAELLPSS